MNSSWPFWFRTC